MKHRINLTNETRGNSLPFPLNMGLVGLIMLGLLALYLLNPFSMGYLFGFLLLPFVVFNLPFFRSNMDSNLFVLTIFSVVYALFYSFQAEATQGKQFIVIYAATPPVFYLMGKYLAAKSDFSRKLSDLLILCFTIYSLPAVISVFSVFLQGGFRQFERNLPMFWDGQIVAATIMGSYLTFNMCIPAILITRTDKFRPLQTLLLLAVFILSLICAIRLGSRTQLAIMLITALVALFYVIPRQSIKRTLILLIVLGGLFYFISTRISFDFSADWLTNFADRMDRSGSDIASGGGRTERWSKAVTNLYKRPLGWDTKEFGYAHNLWLDVARVAGIIPFGFLLVFCIKAFRETLIILQSPVALNFKSVTLLYALAFLLIFMVEPIFEGIFSLFVLFCLFTGILNKVHSREIQ